MLIGDNYQSRCTEVNENGPVECYRELHNDSYYVSLSGNEINSLLIM